MNNSEPIEAESDRIITEIKQKAKEFCKDNPRFANFEIVIEGAMLIGAGIAMVEMSKSFTKS